VITAMNDKLKDLYRYALTNYGVCTLEYVSKADDYFTIFVTINESDLFYKREAYITLEPAKRRHKQ
jgi:hypothetical protein